MTVAARCDNLVHVFGTAGAEVAALRGVDLAVDEGETLALLGPSGAGKTTLLWHLAGLLKPTAGSVEVAGQRLASLTPRELAAFRLREIGVVLQNPGRNLLPYTDTLANVLFAMRPSKYSGAYKRRRARTLLDAVGLAADEHRIAGRLSGGEQQRLAVAVALANNPPVLLADEPTSQLDPVSAAAVLELVRDANNEFGTTVIAVTHDADVGAVLGRTVTIRDGRVGAEGRAGEDFVVVGRDGTIQLPPEMLDALPPGSLARAIRHEHGVDLRRIAEGSDE
jgi:putative ABC transport system ATP-binding protein